MTLLAGFAFSPPAIASVTVGAPVNGTKVGSPVWVRAHNTGCNGLAPTLFGYSVDNSSTLVKGVTRYDIDTKASMSAGTHTIHFKSWVSSGICPVVSTRFSVGGSSGTSTSSTAYTLPSYAVSLGVIDGKGGWTSEHDGGTPGSSRGSTVYPATASSWDYSRKFYMTYTKHGGERWHLSFARNGSATHFALDTYVYLANPSQVANLELDLNQVISTGKTIMFNTQCSSYSKAWEYTTVTSTGASHWKSSNLYCNPKTWKAYAWHHIQIGYHRDSYGNVTHDWVNLDGTHHVFSGTKTYAARWLGWQPGTVLTNFQIDGAYSGSGSVTAYIHSMKFYDW